MILAQTQGYNNCSQTYNIYHTLQNTHNHESICHFKHIKTAIHHIYPLTLNVKVVNKF
jgi:hypothetical protein